MAYKMRMFRSKSAVLVLLWTFTSYSVLISPFKETKEDVLWYYAASIIVLPISGLLADVYFSRYTTIKYGMRLLCFSQIVLNFVQAIIHVKSDKVFKHIEKGVLIFVSIGLSGTLGNTLSFGIDQLIDASSSDLISFINWNSWTFFLANCVFAVLEGCHCDKSNIPVYLSLYISILCTVSVVLDMLLNNWLVKEPVTHNPFQLIYQVLKYAVKSKYPRLRSAFTYWEDKPYSRIDLGKSKYGGPFTTEQVEDVKTFFRILLIVIAAAFVTSTIAMIVLSSNHKLLYYKNDIFMIDCQKSSYAKSVVSCWENLIISNIPNFVVLILLPGIEILIHPVLMKCGIIDRIRFKHKVILGALLLFAAASSLLMMETVGSHVRANHNNSTCSLETPDNKYIWKFNSNYKWLIIPQVLVGICNYIFVTTFLEFVCSQTPYPMRGLVFSISFLLCILPFPISRMFLGYLSSVFSHSKNKYCGIWFYGGLTMYTLLILALSYLGLRFYCYRRRDEEIHNRQIFAENYYDKYLENRLSA